MAQRIADKHGYHAQLQLRNPNGKECVRCHLDHNGKDFSLIHWEPSQKQFDHRLTGYKLEGKHAGLACEKCHTPAYMVPAERALIKIKDLNRSFFGLSQNCVPCHKDIHQGRLGNDCLRCHNFSNWKAAKEFDHSKARYPLTGRHIQVACEKCHKPDVPGGPVRYNDMKFGACIDCHIDPHKGAFKQSCEECHTTAGWKKLLRAFQFDHSKTKYPLLGKHAMVACVDCHAKNDFKKEVPFANCVDCHKADPHKGQFVARPKKGECAECHTIDGWKPSLFGVKEHDTSKYPLKGKHVTVECYKCHLPAGKDTIYKVKFTACLDCHKDAHDNQFAGPPYQNGCENCHTVKDFHRSTYTVAMHRKSHYPLTGAHTTVGCNQCHKVGMGGRTDKILPFRWKDTSCTSCHEDVHMGEFNGRMAKRRADGTPLGCEACHNVRSWADVTDYGHSAEALPPVADVYNAVPNRWALEQPDYRRYPQKGEHLYTKPHWYDPFNRNRFKGDEPIWPKLLGQQIFLNITASAESFFDGRRVPSPSNVSSERPGSSGFFGRGEQAFFDQTLRFASDLFHGDAAFKPFDWRIRVTPEISLNNLKVRELGLIGPDVRSGTDRFDDHASLQEAFVEVKLHDLGPNYDFVSARAGIQQFNADFRGFLLVDEEPALRIFGNLHSDRIEYNLAYFHFLEKNTNSGLNTFERRHQQVLLGNVYLQDFFFPGYTAEFVAAWNKDDPSLHYDDNGFLVRPAPIGNVINQNPGAGPILHGIRVGYLGWLGSGHIHRINLTHAFYQAIGRDTFNPIAGKRVTINAQMAAVELSYDKDWARYRVSALYTSGDANPRDSRARGFDSIVDLPNFAGGLFSFWNREGIRLLGSSVLLTTPGSLIPSLRASKEEGQANFVNPGIFLANTGADFEITPKLRGFANFNFLRFERTEPLEFLLFQSPIHHTIGEDFGVGVEYRPSLSENIIVTGGASALQPGRGFKDIYTGRTELSLFGSVKFTF